MGVDRGGTIPQTTPARAHQSYRHEAFLWHSAEDYTEHLGGFVSDALEADEPVLVVVTPQHRDWLSDGLGDRARHVDFLDMTQLGANPARILPRWHDFVDTHGGRPVRGVGEPIWPGRRPAEVAESQLHEALLNVAVDPQLPLWLICPYDAENLDAAVLEEAQRSHPVIVESQQYHGSTTYTGRAHVDTIFGTELPTPDTAPITTHVTAANAERLEAYVRLECYVAGLPAQTAAQLAEATQHLVAAGLHRGATEVTVRIWNQPDAVVCEVADQTAITDPLHGRLASTTEEHEALWLVNQLCDLVQLRSGPHGTTVRVHTWR